MRATKSEKLKAEAMGRLTSARLLAINILFDKKETYSWYLYLLPIRYELSREGFIFM